MIKLYLKFFCFELNLDINKCKSEKECIHKEEDVETPIDDNSEYEEQLDFFDEIEALNTNNSPIFSKAEEFERELAKQGAIYDIPYTSDIPKRNAISDDVEIITDSFEKEVEDIIEGRR